MNPDFSPEKASAFVKAAGLNVSLVQADEVTGWLDLGAEHLTPWGVVHGGVYTTAVESAATLGASHAVAEQGLIAVGLHNSTDFIRSSQGGRADVRATAIQQGASQQLWEVTITRAEDQKILAQGRVRLQNVTPRPGA